MSALHASARVALVMITTAISAAAFAAPARPPLVFGVGNAWTVVAPDGRLLKQLRGVCGREARDLAVSPDEATLVFTAWSDAVENWLLYACDDGSSPRLLGEAQGYHGNPAFSPDGAWVYFVHHPKKGGPLGMHDPGANAQLYRVRLDGSGLESFTDSKGCKLAPQATASSVVFVHDTCTGVRSIELVSPGRRSGVVTLEHGHNSHFPDLSPDGHFVLITRKTLAATELLSLDVKTKAVRSLWGLPPGYAETYARWGNDATSIIYQRDGAVFRVTLLPKPREEKLADIGGTS